MLIYMILASGRATTILLTSRACHLHTKLCAEMSGRGRGRGQYYKEKYGGGRTATPNKRSYSDAQPNYHNNEPTAAPGHDAYISDDEQAYTDHTRAMGNNNDLHTTLMRIHNKGYKAYHDIAGKWMFPSFTLFVDHVQGDPFASPSRCRVLVPASTAGYPPHLWQSNKARRIALCDFITRRFGQIVSLSGGDIRHQSGGWHGEKGGDMSVDTPGQHVIERTSVLIHPDGSVEARFLISLPARGRTVLGDWASTILTKNLPRYCDQGLRYVNQDAAAILAHVESVEDQQHLRSVILPSLGLVAFIADGSVLPRKSGNCDQPMSAQEAVPFTSPPSLAVTVDLPNRGSVRGLGIPKGITLICGGGFHGKSTVLEALETGVYDKIPGDGRELVVTDPKAVKIRAEDGRRVESVDISPFINNLPFGQATTTFCTPDASGSTSQATNIQEALEIKASTLLIDEDSSATNFMIRDARMAELVPCEQEPITPFLARISGLAAVGVSTVLVVGGTGEYFSCADRVITMNCYTPSDSTDKAHEIAARYQNSLITTSADTIATSNGRSISQQQQQLQERHPPAKNRVIESLQSPQQRRDHHRNSLKVKTRGLHTIQFGDQDVDLGSVDQLVEVSQTRAIAEALLLLQKRLAGMGNGLTLTEILNRLESSMDENGVDALVAGGRKFGNLARPRRFEIAAAINRLRSATLRQN